MEPLAKLAKDFRSFADLAAAYERDRDYRIVRLPRPGSEVAVVAPHGGSIEAHTSDIARDMAGQDFNLYLFEGLSVIRPPSLAARGQVVAAVGHLARRACLRALHQPGT